MKIAAGPGATLEMRTIVEAFFAAARRHAGRVAVRDAARSVTYAELGTQVSAIAAGLAERVERPGPIAILTPHDVRSPAALLGVLAARRGVIPLDADHPDGRNRLIAGHSQAAAVLTVAELKGRARAMFGAGAQVLDLEALAAAAGGEPPAAPSAGDLAYILYTSGSTGAPKGAFQTHGPLYADLVDSVEIFDITPEDRPALFYPPAVAAGLRAMLGTLLAGASAHLLQPTSLGSQGLVREICERGITIFRSSATLFRHVAGAAGPLGLQSLRLVALGGDRVDWADYDLVRAVCRPETRLATHLGATECTLYTGWFADEAFRGKGGALPVGRQLPSARIMLQDPEGAEVPAGEVGEFVIESAYVAQGYWREPERTTDAFAPGPGPELRRYRTGDLGRLRPDGLYEVAGRKDHQIKLRGFRIELGEIESALRACSGVKDGVVLTRTGPGGAIASLAAYVELKPGVAGLAPRHLKAMLAQRLPAYMIPADVVLLDALPWLANFKVDRQRLMAMDASRVARPAAMAPDALTGKIIEAFQSVLRIEGVSAEDDLQGLGGDSLQAVDIALEIQMRLGVRISPEDMDTACPIGELPGRLGLRAAAGPLVPAAG